MGMEEEILPHRSSIEADTVEEERRLAYVGITRARQNLAMTFAAKRKQYGEIIDCSPSRFLDELPRRPRMGRHGRRPARGQGGRARHPRRHPRHAQALSPPRLDCLDFHKSVLPDA